MDSDRTRKGLHHEPSTDSPSSSQSLKPVTERSFWGCEGRSCGHPIIEVYKCLLIVPAVDHSVEYLLSKIDSTGNTINKLYKLFIIKALKIPSPKPSINPFQSLYYHYSGQPPKNSPHIPSLYRPCTDLIETLYRRTPVIPSSSAHSSSAFHHSPQVSSTHKQKMPALLNEGGQAGAQKNIVVKN